MCGLMAIVSLDGAPIPEGPLARGLATLRPRGPDGEGMWTAEDRRAALGHTRLSIIDLAGGAQPLSSRDGRTHVVVNGELYDYERLQRGLRARGHALASASDSEVALHLYRELGTGCLPLLRGEFAFALWDAEQRALFAARDRFGIKPLLYAVHEQRLYVASEMKALFAAGVPCRWSRAGMFEALHFCMAQDQTIYEGVRQVPPGHYLWAAEGCVQVRRYWDLDYPRTPAPIPNEAERIDRLTALLEQAVRTRTRADVPLACYLSGGVDSSTVLGMAARMTDRPVAAFTVAFDHDDYDESGPAARMAARAGAEFHPVRVDGRAYVDVFEDAVAAAEMPHYNGHGPARYLLSRAVRDAGYKVALGGEGADEIFAGYHFVRAALTRAATGGSGPALEGLGPRLLKALRPPSRDTRTLAGISPTLAVLAHGVGFPADLQAELVERAVWLRGLLDPEFVRGQPDPYRAFLARFPWARQLVGRPGFRVILYVWMRSHFPNYVLGAERLDMAHGVEVRLPFLDHHLFEATRDLPAELLYRDLQNKALLRRIAAPDVTEEIRALPKKPFFAPPTALTPESPLLDHARGWIASDDFAAVPFVDHAAVRRWLTRFDRLPQRERAAFDPLIYLLASLAVLQRRYRPAAP